MMMEVILREDVKSLGRAGALVRVKPGYARNFLLPRGMAYEATEGNKKRIEAEQKARNTKSEAERLEATAFAARLSGAAVTIKAKAGEGDRLFGSITSQDIASALSAIGIEVDKRKIDLDHPIKQVGIHTVPIRLHSDVQAEVRVSVVQE